jgi:hypothetical protein
VADLANRLASRTPPSSETSESIKAARNEERETIVAALKRWAAKVQDPARGGALALAADLIHGDVHHEAASVPVPAASSETSERAAALEALRAAGVVAAELTALREAARRVTDALPLDWIIVRDLRDALASPLPRVEAETREKRKGTTHWRLTADWSEAARQNASLHSEVKCRRKVDASLIVDVADQVTCKACRKNGGADGR